MNRGSVAFYTLGCKLNFSETSTIARTFTEQGFQRVEFEQPADVYVINTCSVTDSADSKCRNIVRQALKTSPNAVVAVIGCYAQLKPQEIAQIEGVDIVLGASEKFKLLEYLNNFEERKKQKDLSYAAEVYAGEIKEVKDFVPSFSHGDRTRSFLKVQDGCDYFCAFCTIPLARGFSRNASIAETVAKARKVAATDIKEVVLTGVNIGDFGKDTKETFLDLIKELDEVEGIDRYRISSIEPNLLNDEIIAFVAQSKRFAPHFHIPLQSGSDKILDMMRRRYKSSLYASRVAKIKELMPHACIGVDVICGFPGETEEDFLETYNFLNGLDVSYLHVFTYSERPNTTAIRIKETVPMNERRRRTKMLQILSEKKKRYFYEQQMGNTSTVLFEAEAHGNEMYGFTENYIKVKTAYSPGLVNQMAEIKLTNLAPDSLAEFEFISHPITINA